MQEMAPRQSPRPGRKLVLLLNRLSDAMAKQKRSWECFCKADADAKGSLYPSELSKCVVCMPVCMQVWQGVSKSRVFKTFRREPVRTAAAARVLLEQCGCAHMWDVAAAFVPGETPDIVLV